MNKLKANLIFQIAYQILIILTPLITSPYVSRVLGAENLGIYSYTYSVVNYFTIFAMLGTQNYGSRSIASARDNRKQASKVFSEIFSMQVIAACVAFIGYMVYVFTSKPSNIEIFLLQSIYIFACLTNLNWLFFGLEEFKLTVIRNAVIKIFTICSIFVFVRNQGDLWKYVALLAVGEVISQVLLIPFVHKYVDFQVPQIKEILPHAKPNFILFIPAIAYSLNHVLDKTMIGILSDYDQSGNYYNVEKIINIPKGVITGIGVVMMPNISNNLSRGDIKSNKSFLSLFMYLTSFLAIGMAFGFSATSRDFVPWFFGPGYDDSISLMRVLSFALIFMSLSDLVRMQYLIPNKKDRVYALALFISAIINVTVNSILIPRLGALGAVVGTIVAEAIAFTIQFAVTNRGMNVMVTFCKSGVFLIAGSFMFYMITFLSHIITSEGTLKILLELIIGGSVYSILSVFLLLLVNKEARAYCSRLVKRRKENAYVKRTS